MQLTETSPTPSALLPVAALRHHLRLGSGFSDDTTQDGLLETYLRAALAQIEGRVSRALLRRGFCLRLARWGGSDSQRLPIGPVHSIAAVTVHPASGAPRAVDPARYALFPDAARPHLVARGTSLPLIPTGGAVEITFTAGFGPVWDDIPADLRQAVLILAAQFYEARDGLTDPGLDVRALLAPWRDIRIGGRS